MTMSRAFAVLLLAAALSCSAGCGLRESHGGGATPGVTTDSPFHAATEKQPATEAVIEENFATLDSAAKAQRAKWQGKTFEEFEASVYREPGPGGKYVVSGDIAIADRKHLQEFYTQEILTEPAGSDALTPEKRGELAVFSWRGVDQVWNSTDRKLLTYCVSTAFGNRHARVAADMQAAGAAWQQCADVAFAYVASEDANCTANNDNVVFDVSPVNVHGRYLARAFFPNDRRSARNVVIDESAFRLDPNGTMQLVGILRHELGHALGLRHEQTRPEAGACFEDTNWRPLTAYDRFSVMHYPQCNGGGDWSLTLTPHDKSGIACLYGPAAGFAIDPSLVDVSLCNTVASPPHAGSATTKTFADQHVSIGEEKRYQAFGVQPGSRFDVRMSGNGASAGDPDVYVRFDQTPGRASGEFVCRPFLTGADETCSLDVPTWTSQVFVMVHGFAAGDYDLAVTSVASGQ